MLATDFCHLVRACYLGFHSPSLAVHFPMGTLHDAHGGRAVLRGLLQDGAVLALVLDLSAKLVMAASPSVLSVSLVRPQRSMKLATNSVAKGVAFFDGKLIVATAPVSLSTQLRAWWRAAPASATPALV